MSWLRANSPAVEKLANALKLPKDVMSLSISLNVGEVATATVMIPITDTNVDALAQIIEEEHVMIGGDIALYGRLFDDPDGKIEKDLSDDEDLSEEHF